MDEWTWIFGDRTSVVRISLGIMYAVELGGRQYAKAELISKSSVCIAHDLYLGSRLA